VGGAGAVFQPENDVSKEAVGEAKLLQTPAHDLKNGNSLVISSHFCKELFLLTGSVKTKTSQNFLGHLSLKHFISSPFIKNAFTF
jgi:hypothetical protein